MNRTNHAQICGRFAKALLILAYCSVAISCGYHFRPVGSPRNMYIESIAIPPFSSTSSYAGIEDDFTKIVRQEFITRSPVRIEDEASAQAVLRGRLYSLTTEPLTYSITQQTINGFLSTDEVTSARILKVRVAVSLKNRATGEVIWQDSNLNQRASFQVSSDPLVTQYNQRMALMSIAKDLAIQIYSRTMERF